MTIIPEAFGSRSIRRNNDLKFPPIIFDRFCEFSVISCTVFRLLVTVLRLYSIFISSSAIRLSSCAIRSACPSLAFFEEVACGYKEKKLDFLNNFYLKFFLKIICLIFFENFGQICLTNAIEFLHSISLFQYIYFRIEDKNIFFK